MRVLVTGGAGFIGSHVVENLFRLGHEVSVVDSLVTGKATHLPAGVRLHKVDVASSELITAVMTEKPEAIVHLAAQISVSASSRNPEEDARVNIGGALNIIRAANASGCQRIVYGSSAAVYGNPALLPLSEDSPMRPLSPYGVSKRAAEDYLLAYAAASNLTVGVLRYGNVYGPRQAVSKECGVITIFVNAILDGVSPTIYGDGSATRDYVYVSDVVEATVAAISQKSSDIYNISSGNEVTVQSLWDHLTELTGKSLVPIYGPERPGDIERSCLNPQKALQELGWKSSISLRKGLQQTLAYYSGLGGGLEC